MHALSSAPSTGWTFGGSILTFAFPMILFIVVAGALYVLYTKPELVPGHSVQGERPVSYTPVPHTPQADAAPAAPVRADAGPAATGQAADSQPAGDSPAEGTAGPGSSGNEAGEVAGTEDAE